MSETMGQRIANARNEIGWTRRELAQEIRSRQNNTGSKTRGWNVDRWERDAARPRRRTLFFLAAALYTTVEWLESGEGP